MQVEEVVVEQLEQSPMIHQLHPQQEPQLLVQKMVQVHPPKKKPN